MDFGTLHISWLHDLRFPFYQRGFSVVDTAGLDWITSCTPDIIS